jgi:amino acid adenylation domain-containing protein
MDNLLDYLEATAARLPDKTAVAGVDRGVTFSELLRLGKQTGLAVSNAAGAARRPVAVLTNHSVADVAAFVGIMYAGCFYVPLDGTAPESHIKARLDAIEPALVINAKEISELPRAELDSAGEEKLLSIRREMISTDPAYAIFTSGSTGVPKAALISHMGVINLIEWQCDLYGFNEDTVFAGQSPFYFDASVQDTYAAFKTGATVYLLPKKLFLSPLSLLRQMDEWKVNTLMWATAGIKLLAVSKVFTKYVPVYLRQVIFGGENMPAGLLNVWRKALPRCRFVNEYGPSEISVACSAYIIERGLNDGESVPIGEPCRNERLILINEAGNEAADGEPGEIYVRGVGVGLGYYRDAKRTAEAFVQNPLHSDYPEIVYKTGDIAKYNANGELVYISRGDGQIKHMGTRVELGEIEAAAASLTGVDETFADYDKQNGRILLFYQGESTAESVTERLAARLPIYMRPSRIIKLAEMPRLPNGKTDKLTARKEYYRE